MKILLASNNPGKLWELRAILQDESFEVIAPEEVDLHLDVPETGSTFEENAVLKAEAFHRASGLVALADDSGLVVEALDGWPGVYSARAGGEGATDDDRNQLVLSRLEGVPWEQRRASFVAAVAIAGAGPTVPVFWGRVEGIIGFEPRGPYGFGYDPIFYFPPFGQTFGQTEPAQKAKVSHRGRALRQAAAWLRRYT